MMSDLDYFALSQEQMNLLLQNNEDIFKQAIDYILKLEESDQLVPGSLSSLYDFYKSNEDLFYGRDYNINANIIKFKEWLNKK